MISWLKKEIKDTFGDWKLCILYIVLAGLGTLFVMWINGFI